MASTADGNPPLSEDSHRNILKGFYSIFKAAGQDLQFVLLTWVTKFSHVSVFSGFNHPKDISMASRYDSLCGITEEELYAVFGERIEEMASEHGFTVSDIKSRLKKRYDGYHFSKRMTDIYNPFSLLNALDSKRMDDYWFKTGTDSRIISAVRAMNSGGTSLVRELFSSFLCSCSLHDAQERV
ncbi:MAG: AAA family ATPase [Clostridium sp.]|nr:AAA family ATPase [Clostridium sp.]